MKKILFLSILAFALQSTQAQSILRLVNNTDKKILFAYVHYTEIDKWVCDGWYAIEAYQALDFDLGDYQGKVYIHGRQSAYLGLSEVTWGEGYSFCVDQKENFKIRDTEHYDCTNKRSFSEKKIYTGINKWDFNP